MKNVIEAIEEKLQAQKDEIYFKDLQIEDLKRQLDAALIEIANLKNNVLFNDGQKERETA